jgi:putative redox protein
MDILKARGGTGKGMTPIEATLAAAAACAGIDIVNIVTKMRGNIKSLRVAADSTQAREHPMYFNYMKFTFYISGDNIDEQKVRKAVDLSMNKYCAVKATMADKCRFETEIVIE